MGRIVVIGEGAEVRCYRLAGADVTVAEDPAAVVAAWSAIPPDTVLAVLTRQAAAALVGLEPPAPGCMSVVIDG